MQVFGLIVIFAIVVLFDLTGLMKTNNRTKSMVVYFSLIALGLTFSLLYVIDKAPSSPAVIMERIIRMAIPGEYTVQ